MPKRADSPARWSDGSTSSGVRVRHTREPSFRRQLNPAEQEASEPLPLPPVDYDSTFRVYTPNEMKDAPLLRRSFRPPPSLTEALSNNVVGDAANAGPRPALKWLGLGAGGGVLLLALFLVIFSLGDDKPTTTKSYAQQQQQPTTAAATVAGHAPSAADPATAGTPTDDNANANDFELPDDNAPVGAGRAASKRVGGKPGNKRR